MNTKIKTALAKVKDASTDVVAVWRDHIACEQASYEQFSRWLDVLRTIPEELLSDLVQCRDKNMKEAFHQCQPNYISLDEFVAAAADKLETAPKSKNTKTKDAK